MNRASGTSYRGTTYSERMATAPCSETDPDLSFPGGKGKFELAHAEAKKACDRCPLTLKQECLELALRTEGRAQADGRHGVFGGLDPVERAALARERRDAETRERGASEHGSAARAQKHRRAGETPCGPCMVAEAEARRNRAQDKGWPKKKVAA